jgi:hypothetical protein
LVALVLMLSSRCDEAPTTDLAPKPRSSAAPETAAGQNDAPQPAPKNEVLLGTALGDRLVRMRNEQRDCKADAALTLELVVAGRVSQRFALRPFGDTPFCSGRDWELKKLDFNFDGYDDLAVSLDHSGPYGGTAYGVFIFEPRGDRYVEAPDLSNVTQTSTGFRLDPRRKLLIASSKSGCCIGWQSEFYVRGIKPVLRSTEKVTRSFHGGKCTVVTEVTRPNAARQTTSRPCTAEEGGDP